jgi:peptidoglycan pentaglycine glycine transferase (the first glycine)
LNRQFDSGIPLMENNLENFMQQDKDFLQSEEWRKFQESAGRKTYSVNGKNFSASVIEHSLPIVGKYFYIPRGPVIQSSAFFFPDSSGNSSKPSFSNIINLAKENKAGWIRFEPASEEILEIIKKSVGTNFKFVRSPHDMQPREILVMDITKSEEELLAEMKQKTRYNIKLAQKKNIKVSSQQSSDSEKYIDEFIRLVKITAKRDGITPHPESYYRQMLETIPSDILKLYVAEYDRKVIAANLMIFFGKNTIYLHGASDNEYRNVMAPYLLQWQAIQDAKKAGCEEYDFGGVKGSCSTATNFKLSDSYKSWSGITKFKTGFAPNTKPVEFPGSYDIIINHTKYKLYKIMQKMKSFL